MLIFQLLTSHTIDTLWLWSDVTAFKTFPRPITVLAMLAIDQASKAVLPTVCPLQVGGVT